MADVSSRFETRLEDRLRYQINTVTGSRAGFINEAGCSGYLSNMTSVSQVTYCPPSIALRDIVVLLMSGSHTEAEESDCVADNNNSRQRLANVASRWTSGAFSLSKSA